MLRKAFSPLPYGIIIAFAGAFAVFVSGCRNADPISEYKVKKTPRERMLAGIVKHELTAWFFKLTGPEELNEEVQSKFRDFIKSVHFGEESGKPAWDLPEGWKHEADFAITVPVGSSELQLSIQSEKLGPFIADGEGWEFFQLRKINKWRSRLQLLPMRSAKELNGNSQQIALADGSATVIEFMGIPPVQVAANELPPGHPPMAPNGNPPAVRRRDSGLKFKKPDSWQAAPLKTFSVETFEAKDGNQQIVTTVTPVGGGLLFNINRWCGQVKVDSFKTEEDLKPVRKDIMVDGAKGIVVELVGNGKTILGVIVTKDDQQWVIKLMGDNDLAKREKANFMTFVQSLKF